jgi:hypothetical protein
MDFGNLLTKVLPWIGAAATGNVPALITMAASEVGAALGVEVKPTPEAIGAAVASATPEQLMAMKDRDLAFQERMQAMGFAQIKDMATLALEETKAFVADTADARGKFASDDKVFVLGVIILCAFVVFEIAVLVVLYQMVSGKITADVSTIAVVAGLIGSINGYFASNAQQVVSFFFGTSKGSQTNGNALRDTLAEALKQLGATAAVARVPAPTEPGNAKQ